LASRLASQRDEKFLNTPSNAASASSGLVVDLASANRVAGSRREASGQAMSED
jgi:hypothetical protein